jgi:outer membrane protein TolC
MGWRWLDVLHPDDREPTRRFWTESAAALLAARRALHLVQANFQAGLASYSDVLIADVQYHQAKIAELQTIATRYQDTVALFVALGGGWWNAE